MKKENAIKATTDFLIYLIDIADFICYGMVIVELKAVSVKHH